MKVVLTAVTSLALGAVAWSLIQVDEAQSLGPVVGAAHGDDKGLMPVQAVPRTTMKREAALEGNPGYNIADEAPDEMPPTEDAQAEQVPRREGCMTFEEHMSLSTMVMQVASQPPLAWWKPEKYWHDPDFDRPKFFRGIRESAVHLGELASDSPEALAERAKLRDWINSYLNALVHEDTGGPDLEFVEAVAALLDSPCEAVRCEGVWGLGEMGKRGQRVRPSGACIQRMLTWVDSGSFAESAASLGALETLRECAVYPYALRVLERQDERADYVVRLFKNLMVSYPPRNPTQDPAVWWSGLPQELKNPDFSSPAQPHPYWTTRRYGRARQVVKRH